MTGPEIAVGAAILKGAKSAGDALQGNEKERNAILDAAKDSPGFEVAARERGDRIAAKQIVINWLFKPVFWLARNHEYFADGGGFTQDLGEKLKGLPQDDLTPPAPNVAAQALEGLSYSLDEPDLKEMYLNLLATASQKETADTAHPSFAEIIRQLTPVEARVLPMFTKQKGTEVVPVAEIRAVVVSGSHVVLERHVSDLVDPETWNPVEVPRFAMYVDNWVRLGLVNVSYLQRMTRDGAYDYVEGRPEYQRQLIRSDFPEGYSVKFQGGVLERTDFGSRFVEAVAP